MEIMSALLNWDRTVFEWINTGLGNTIFDQVLPWFREKWFWAPVYLFIAAFLGMNFKKRGIWAVAAFILTVGCADFTSNQGFKKQVQRIRPCNDPVMASHVIQRVPCGSGYSFTSNHAANHFAAAIFLIGLLGFVKPWIKPALIVWASSIAFAQVYVGVHYPADVLAGAILGSGIGWAGVTLFNRRYPLSAVM